jgi:hypothetical protein
VKAVLNAILSELQPVTPQFNGGAAVYAEWFTCEPLGGRLTRRNRRAGNQIRGAALGKPHPLLPTFDASPNPIPTFDRNLATVDFGNLYWSSFCGCSCVTDTQN